ncbi:MAG: TonB-dependent receptor [Bacteroidetes bacterium]|nr:TonB-dependent receptor [Bacteroidota bacterium]
MPRKIPVLFILLFLSSFVATAQMATISGYVKDDRDTALDLVTVAIKNSGTGTSTDREGHYKLEVKAGRNIPVVFSFIGYEPVTKYINANAGEHIELNVKLKTDSRTLGTVEITSNTDRDAGSTYIDVRKVHYMPTTGGGIEDILKTLVGSNNELTSQYNVRGGNYDENLVYVNDFEINRPFLVRSGQQEGLSFVNPDLAEGVNFSVGGFQAKYGDKMSSVLDVTYKRPKRFAGSVMASLLGASLHLEGASKNEKLTYLFGARQKTNQYLLQAQPTKGVYNPSFTDVQALINYRFNKKWEVEAIGNYARNRFNFVPEEATSSFGLVNKAYQLRVFFNGGEIDQFDSRFAGISTTYRPNDKLKLKLLASGFQTNEYETYDIGGEYLLGELETDLSKENFGQIKTYLGTGVIQDHARNYLKVNVGNLAHRGSYSAGKHFIQWGADVNITSIADQLHEWERRDSSGFTQPYDTSSLRMMYLYRASEDLNYSTLSGFVQDNFRFNDSLDLTMSIGARFNYDALNHEFIASPRLQAAYKPRHWKRDMVFRAAAGVYAQPPFYREMRDLQGNLNTDLKAQKSYHLLLGTNYNFKVLNRPFKFTTELYYKYLWDVVPYIFDNVRIRYYGKNEATAYAYGGEVRLYGDIVKGATSWISIGVMKTSEYLKDSNYHKVGGGDSTVNPGYIPRPADQRFMIGMYFEDYIPHHPAYKAHINLMYATGLPIGPPNAPRYADTLRLPDYKRVDIGFSALLLDGAKKERPYHSFFKNISSIWASIEVFNLLGIQNTLSYTWIQDQSSGKTFAVPNRLTSRLINVKLLFNF